MFSTSPILYPDVTIRSSYSTTRLRNGLIGHDVCMVFVYLCYQRSLLKEMASYLTEHSTAYKYVQQEWGEVGQNFCYIVPWILPSFATQHVLVNSKVAEGFGVHGILLW